MSIKVVQEMGQGRKRAPHITEKKCKELKEPDPRDQDRTEGIASHLLSLKYFK
jgi:hypothetical protein